MLYFCSVSLWHIVFVGFGTNISEELFVYKESLTLSNRYIILELFAYNRVKNIP